MWQAAAIAAGVQLAGGIAGNMAAAGSRAAAKDAARQAYQELLKMGLPPDLSREIIFKEFESAGVYSPNLEAEIDAGISEFESIKEDPALRDAQMSALEEFQRRGRTGLAPEDRAAMNAMRSEVAQQAEGQRQRILQDMQARGQGGSGASLAAQLQASQGSVNQAAAGGDRLAAEASQRALQALSSGADLSGQVRGQDFDVASAKASAADEMKRFNTTNQVNRQARNVAAQNQAMQYNLNNKQDIMNRNTQMANDEKLRQSNAKRNHWLDTKDYHTSISNAHQGWANQMNKEGDRKAGQITGIANGVAGIVGAYGKAQGSDSYDDELDTDGPSAAAQTPTVGRVSDPYDDSGERLERLRKNRQFIS